LFLQHVSEPQRYFFLPPELSYVTVSLLRGVKSFKEKENLILFARIHPIYEPHGFH